MLIAICDDSPDDLALLRGYCRQYDPGLAVRTYSSAKELLASYPTEKPDIVFMDIEMEPPNGFEAAQRLRAERDAPVIVFTTQTLNYAVRGYGLALRYLPKPIDYCDFAEVLELALRERTPQKISVSAESGTEILNVADILWFEVFGHNVCFHMADSRELQVRSTFSSVLEQVRPYAFAQIHKSYCVNLSFVERAEQSNVVLTDGTTLPVGRSFVKSFRERLGNYLRGR